MPFELLVAGGGSAELLCAGSRTSSGGSGWAYLRRTGACPGLLDRSFLFRWLDSGRLRLRIRAFRFLGFIGRLPSRVFQASRQAMLFMRYVLVGE